MIYREQNKEEVSEEDIPRIKVSTLISKMAFYYEKIRNTVDYKEENLHRKNAIERILRRQVVIETAIVTREKSSIEVSKHLLTELIRAGYLPNNSIPEEKIEELSIVIGRYLKLKNYIFARVKDAKERGKFARWVIALSASDLEERLGRSEIDIAVIGHMNKILLKKIVLPDNSPFEKDKDIQIFVGIHRNYMKFDRDMMGCILFKYYNPTWDSADEEEIERLANNINDLYEKIESQIDHPLASQLNRIISRYTVFFRILTDVIGQDPRGIYENFKKDPKAFPRQIKNICTNWYKRSRTKLWRSAVRSIVYIFITKSIFAVILEVPASQFFGQGINAISLAINISFPAFLLFIIVLFTRLPSEDNSKKIIEGINEVTFIEYEKKDLFRLRKPVQRGAVTNAIFGILYALTFLISVSIVIWALSEINFNFVSIIIFLFFLAFVSFFSIRIRKNARDLIIVESKESILSLISDFFYIPIVSAGKWLSEKFSRINVFVFILDFIIEAPFKVFVEIAEEWTEYVKERKEEIV